MKQTNESNSRLLSNIPLKIAPSLIIIRQQKYIFYLLSPGSSARAWDHLPWRQTLSDGPHWIIEEEKERS